MAEQQFHTTRREFLGGGLTLLSAAGTLPIVLGKSAFALADQQPTGTRRNDSRKILVVVQLAGGNDGLNTVVPYEMDPYYELRRRIALRKQDVHKLDSGLGLHPAATGLKELYDEGRMAVIQGVGYPNPNRSHFVSMDVWHTADPNQREHTGWLGRYFDHCCKGDDPTPEPIDGVALMGEAPLALQGDRFTPLAFERPDSLAWRGGKRDDDAERTFRLLNNQGGQGQAVATAESNISRADFLQRAALKALVGADDIRAATDGELGGGRRRRAGAGQLGQQLDLVARMIAADLPTRIYYVSLGGFDTHTNQIGRHENLMRQLGDAMKNFIDTLSEQNLLDRVLVMTFSEFGRRVQENASGGTDHGQAAPMFLFGSKLRPGLHMKHPDLGKLDSGDLKYVCDFRRVYATVMRDWLGMRSQAILGGVNPLRLIKR